MRIRQSIGKLIDAWYEFWRGVEGPELEPRLWHSHYIAVSTVNDMLPSLGNKLAGRVLDVGSGTGYAKRFLDPATTIYTPIDLPSGRDAHDGEVSMHAVKPVIYCSGYALPFPDGCIDSAMSCSVLEHVLYPERILREVFRVLRPGGIAMFFVPFSFPVHGFPADYWRWTPEGLREMVQRLGFEILETRPIGNAVSSLVTNFILTFRHHLVPKGGLAYRAYMLAIPFFLIMQTLLNGFAVLFRNIDARQAYPIGVVVLAAKPFGRQQ